jgi:hypothetical protein
MYMEKQFIMERLILYYYVVLSYYIPNVDFVFSHT